MYPANSPSMGPGSWTRMVVIAAEAPGDAAGDAPGDADAPPDGAGDCVDGEQAAMAMAAVAATAIQVRRFIPRRSPRSRKRMAGEISGPPGRNANDGREGSTRLTEDRLVGDVERPVDDLEALRELLLGDAQRRVRVDRVVRREGVEAV